MEKGYWHWWNVFIFNNGSLPPALHNVFFQLFAFLSRYRTGFFTRFHKTRQLMLLDDMLLMSCIMYIYTIYYIYIICVWLVYVYHMNHHVSLNCCATHCLICLISQERCGFTRLSCMRHKLRHVYVSQLQASELVSSRGWSSDDLRHKEEYMVSAAAKMMRHLAGIACLERGPKV